VPTPFLWNVNPLHNRSQTLPQTVSGNHASREATNDYWQDAPGAPMTDEGETEAKVRAEGEQLSKEE
jgi:hypothetical protein